MDKIIKFDEIGYWSEIKLEIIKRYAQEYSKILTKQKTKNPKWTHVYIDAFSGAGINISKSTGEDVLGSPLNALNLENPFDEYYFIDLDKNKIDWLKGFVGQKENVHIYSGDCNKILLEEVFPKVRYEDYRRGLCLLDPYGLHLDWKVIKTAGESGSIEIFLNFPVMDINRNVLWHSPEKVSSYNISRMNGYWGDNSWQKISYTKTPDLFGEIELQKSAPYVIVKQFQERLKNVAIFRYVPNPIPMRNTKGIIVYYLFFASQNKTGNIIASHIFKKYKNKGVISCQ